MTLAHQAGIIGAQPGDAPVATRSCETAISNKLTASDAKAYNYGKQREICRCKEEALLNIDSNRITSVRYYSCHEGKEDSCYDIWQ